MSSTKAGKRHTRLQSILEEKNMAQNKTIRDYFTKSVRRIEEQIKNEAVFETWTKGELNERVKKLDDASTNLEKIHMNMMCEDEHDEAIEREDEEFDELMITLKANIRPNGPPE